MKLNEWGKRVGAVEKRLEERKGGFEGVGVRKEDGYFAILQFQNT